MDNASIFESRVEQSSRDNINQHSPNQILQTHPIVEEEGLHNFARAAKDNSQFINSQAIDDTLLIQKNRSLVLNVNTQNAKQLKMGWQGESLELISGQSFMFINKDEFIIQLKVIKEHFDRQDEMHPLRSLLYDFTVTFIDNYRHLMYQDENKVFQT